MLSTGPKLFRSSFLPTLCVFVTVAVGGAVMGQDPTGRPTEPPPKGKKTTTKPPPAKPEPKAITVILTILTDPPECVVHLNGERRGVTNKEGKLQFERLPLGHYTIEVQKKEYHSQVRGFEAGADSPTIKFTLEPKLDDVVKEFDALIAAGKLTGPEAPNAFEVAGKLSGKFPDRPETQRMRGVLAAKLGERIGPVIDRTISSWRTVTPDEMSRALDAAMNALVLREGDKRLQAQAAYLRGVRAFREWQVAGVQPEGGAPGGNGGSLAAARSELEAAVKADESWAPGQYRLGIVLLNIPDAKAAEAVLLKAVQLEPRWAFAHAALGSAYYTDGKVKESIETYRKAIEVDPKCAAAHAGLGFARATKGEIKDGIKDIERAKQLDPASGLPHLYLGTIYSQYSKSKEIAMAIEELKKAIEKNHDSLEFQNDVAQRLMAELTKRKVK